MSQYTDSPNLTRLAGEALSQHRLVRLSANTWVYCDAGEMPTGVVRELAADGSPVVAHLVGNKPGTHKMVAAGAISRGDDVFTAADGKISTTNAGVYAGVALAAASGNNSVIEVLSMPRRVLMVSVAASAAIGANSTDEATFDKSFTIPAAELKVGSVLRIKVSGILPSVNGTPQCDVRLKVGTETIATATVAAGAANDQFNIEADVVIRTLGALGTLVAQAKVAFDAAGQGAVYSNKAEATEDTTGGLAVTVTGQFNASHASNTARLDILSVEHIR